MIYVFMIFNPYYGKKCNVLKVFQGFFSPNRVASDSCLNFLKLGYQ